MKLNDKLLVLLMLVFLGSPGFAQKELNQLSRKEMNKGWKLLFNGQDLKGWTKPGGGKPGDAWQVRDGVLTLDLTNGKKGGDLITDSTFSDFELILDFKLSPGGNSGIKYYFTQYEKGGWLGQEYQILDNENHPDAKMGTNGNRQQAALYDVLPVQKKTENRVGEWNQARIVAKGDKVEHYINGVKVLSYDKSSEVFKKARANSKFKDAVPAFGEPKSGHILLQDHGDEVSFRNIKIRAL